jgi:nitrite reductase/ring-hydroxylating ferredoxin subunit
MDIEVSMNRKDFLLKLGIGGGALLAVMAAGCLGACSNPASVNKPTGNVNFTLDLTSSANSALNSIGGYVISNQVVVARVKSGAFVAVTQECSHQGNLSVVYLSSSDQFYCGVHGALYSTSGGGLNSYGSNGLTVYKTSLSGNILTVTS